MKVILKRNLFTPRGRFRSDGKNAIDFPDDLAKHLPKDAVIVSGGPGKLGLTNGQPGGEQTKK